MFYQIEQLQNEQDWVFVGRNGFVISPDLDTWTYLGETLVSIPFEPDDPILDSCGDCTICVDRCPTGALVGNGQLNSQKCISFLTQTKGYLQDEYRYKIGNCLYGCDTCQQVCPKNKGIDTQHDDIVLEPEILKPRLVPLLQMTNKEFKKIYGHLAGAWRGKKRIQRNAIIALAHFKEESAIPELKEVALNDPRPMIRGTAYWAIGQILGEGAQSFIDKNYEKERSTSRNDKRLGDEERIKMTNHIVLFQPEIPANTGNIARTCAGTLTHLHLIKPLGFSTEDKMLKRAGLDYWEHVNITYHESIEEFFESTEGKYYLLTKFGQQIYSDFDFSNTKEDYYFIFGKETTGLPDWVKEIYADTALRIPMSDKIRSLNLSNTAALLIYEALKQQGFPNLF
ncbi:(Fe-S)-binding protein [Staphylococcus saccharolyticus]|uniref:Putative tRNA (cytidine(34)-2'-O)-methyltransferase n=2 Tax=Staphylococcus saccharolyticus TaxID=33028 RepID=A0A380H2K0_9STAP|nr:(Fe-S)-binding protein [Staphylococcus saccharolyticus]